MLLKRLMKIGKEINVGQKDNKMNKKILILIIVILIVIAGIGAYFILKKLAPPIGKCGDGICQKTEEEKNSCLQDCKTTPPPSTGIMPKGNYSAGSSDAVLSSPAVAGVLIGFDWNNIEKSEGNFNWKPMDDAIKEITDKGKVVTLNMLAGGIRTPDWVKNLPGVQLFSFVDVNQYHPTYCQNLTMPVYWDPIFLEKKKNFIRAVGQKYANNPKIVGVMVSFAAAINNDMHVPHSVGTTPCGTANDIQNWKNVGYTTDKMLNAAKEVIDTWAAAFPNSALKLPIAPTHKDLDGTASTLAELVVNWAYSQYPDRLYAQMTGLDTSTPYPTDSSAINASPSNQSAEGIIAYFMKLLTNRPQIGLQMKAAASNGDKDNCRQNGKQSPCPSKDVLQKSVEIALSYGPRFIEYWREDAGNSELYPVFQQAKDTMGD